MRGRITLRTKHRKISSQPIRTALLSVTTATAMAATIAVSAPVPTPPALLAQEQHSVNLTAASTPYQQAQEVINTLLPALVNTFGARTANAAATELQIKLRLFMRPIILALGGWCQRTHSVGHGPALRHNDTTLICPELSRRRAVVS